MKPIEVRLVGRFRLSSKYPGQHEHLLYKAVHSQTDTALFLKGEQVKSKPTPNFLSILQQGKILQTMQGGIGIPHMHWCGLEEDYNFIVLQQLQCNFIELLKKCNNKLSPKSVLMFGSQAILILQYYHFKNFIHNHVNPKHFMIGSGQKYGKLFLVDYSNSIRYRDAQTLEHIDESVSNDKKLEIRNINMEFSSIRYHKGLTPSRKDDLISLLYVMLYLLKGLLPWSSIMTAKRSQNERSRLILEIKQKTSAQQLFDGYPQLLILYEYSQKLNFDQKPRYTYYKNIFTEKIEKSGQVDDKIYDWYLLEEDEDDELDIDLSFDIIPNEEEFIKQLTEEIKIREKSQAEKEKNLSESVENNRTQNIKKKSQKDCTIY